ncbi:hypothetical protein EDC17_101130 [Sphingobacterium alimentarium]|uniref:Uncharacterized protein n=1 Tax=Sphingobacterium alimentarium TaxID=797292 RepID=A0A4R3VUD6_9SPHI|nr:hypothetical protein [Sphingobacterium alimentarium]TCV17113.1 hypothetical protein EDC17_101130 [Sphingobacterium alimentarium]
MAATKKVIGDNNSINGYQLTRAWFDFAFEKIEAKAIHTALFMWILELNNRLNWKKHFGLPTQDTMEGLSIGNKKTYLTALKDLSDWGFIKIIQESKNQYSACIIEICRVKNATAQHTALSPALRQHSILPYQKSNGIDNSTDHSIDFSIDSSTGSSTAPIDKPINNETKKPINNESMIENENLPPSIQEVDLDKILPDAVISVETVIKLLKSERWGAWRDRFGMKNSVLPDKMFILLDLFEEHLKDQNQFTKSTRDAQLHFVSWYGKVYLKNVQKESALSKDVGEKPTHEGVDKEIVGKWIWRFGDWRDTTTLTADQKKRNGLK